MSETDKTSIKDSVLSEKQAVFLGAFVSQYIDKLDLDPDEIAQSDQTNAEMRSLFTQLDINLDNSGDFFRILAGATIAIKSMADLLMLYPELTPQQVAEAMFADLAELAPAEYRETT